MRSNLKFEAEEYAKELWAEIEKIGSTQLATDEAKTAHIKIFFKRKDLSPPQRQAVMNVLQSLFSKYNSPFDPMPNVLELYHLWSNRQFQYFFKQRNEGSNRMDLTVYFNEKRIPLWQQDTIIENFQAYMNYKAGENRKKMLLPLLVCYGGALLLTFLTPNLLQQWGIIAPDAGWGVKIINGLGSFFLYFLIAKRVSSFWLDKVLLNK